MGPAEKTKVVLVAVKLTEICVAIETLGVALAVSEPIILYGILSTTTIHLQVVCYIMRMSISISIMLKGSTAAYIVPGGPKRG